MDRDTRAPHIMLEPQDRLAPPPVPAPRARSLPLRRLCTALVAAGVLGGAMILVETRRDSAMAELASVPLVLPRQDWVDLAQPARLISLNAPNLEGMPRSYAARRHVAGGRQDMLTFGHLAGRALYLRLAFYRFGDEDIRSAPFFVELARRAAEDGLAIARSEQPSPLATRLGDFDTAEATLRGPAGEHACLAYRLERPVPGLRISGYACGTSAQPIKRRALACILDNLEIIRSQDSGSRKSSPASEPRRGAGCGRVQTGTEAAKSS